jgi:acylphosphatase
METDNQRLHVIVCGIVQGVGFRFFVYKHGQLLKLHGWVRNRINGDVETLAEGPRNDLNYLLEKLKEGPEMAQVIEVKADWQPSKGDLPVFTVLPTDY